MSIIRSLPQSPDREDAGLLGRSRRIKFQSLLNKPIALYEGKEIVSRAYTELNLSLAPVELRVPYDVS